MKNTYFFALSLTLFPSLASAQASGEPGFLASFLPMFLIVGVFWVLLIQPQRKRMKQHEEMIKNIRRNDTVVTAGGIKGKITKIVDENEVEVQIAKDVTVTIMRSTLTNVVSKPEDAKKSSAKNDNKTKKKNAA